jgi:hypothetical protein
MLWLIDPLVNRVPILKNPEPSKPGRRKAEAAPAPARRRLSVSERERQIVDGAIQFFAENASASRTPCSTTTSPPSRR